jgi:hypothetical protein
MIGTAGLVTRPPGRGSGFEAPGGWAALLLLLALVLVPLAALGQASPP